MGKSQHDAFAAGADFHARITTGAPMRQSESEAVERQAHKRYDDTPSRPMSNQTVTPYDYDVCVTMLAGGHITPDEFEAMTGRKPL